MDGASVDPGEVTYAVVWNQAFKAIKVNPTKGLARRLIGIMILFFPLSTWADRWNDNQYPQTAAILKEASSISFAVSVDDLDMDTMTRLLDLSVAVAVTAKANSLELKSLRPGKCEHFMVGVAATGVVDMLEQLGECATKGCDAARFRHSRGFFHSQVMRLAESALSCRTK